MHPTLIAEMAAQRHAELLRTAARHRAVRAATTGSTQSLSQVLDRLRLRLAPLTAQRGPRPSASAAPCCA